MLAADERGQVLPLLVFVVIALMAAGVIVFWLGVSTAIESKAQTAADAAALAGEQELLYELEHPPYTIDWGQVCAQAQQYAAGNDATDLSCEHIQTALSTLGWDVEVEAQSLQALGQGSVAPGTTAVAWARASTDPYAQSSPASSALTTSSSCQASLDSGPTFNAHPGQYGFFPKPGTNYSQGCEPKLAGALDALGVKLQLHLIGQTGYVSGTTAVGGNDPAAAAHACGAASTTLGIPPSITNSALAQYGLTRPFVGDPQEIALTASPGCTQQTTTAPASNGQPVTIGNSNVHLVPLAGGPQGLALPVSGVAAPIGLNQMQIGCTLYKVATQLGADQKVMLALFLAGWDESTMQNLPYGMGDSLGVLQQQAIDGWGTPQEEMNPQDAAEMFLIGDDAGSPFYDGLGSSAGAIRIDQQQPGLAPSQLAQAVQGSYDLSGGNYAAQMTNAQNMLSAIHNGACSAH